MSLGASAMNHGEVKNYPNARPLRESITKKVTFLWTLSVPPLAPPSSKNKLGWLWLYGGCGGDDGGCGGVADGGGDLG